jgi:hypothetical protein
MTTLESRLWDRLCQLTNDGATPLVKDQFLEMVRTEVGDDVRAKHPLFGVDAATKPDQTSWYIIDGIVQKVDWAAPMVELSAPAQPPCTHDTTGYTTSQRIRFKK